nr:ABC transporter ATP-binding protein [uncultured Sphingobacterium sp.]
MGDVEFEEGIYWIKGRNGSGKSTLLKCLARISSFDGEITYEGCSSLFLGNQYRSVDAEKQKRLQI